MKTLGGFKLEVPSLLGPLLKNSFLCLLCNYWEFMISNLHVDALVVLMRTFLNQCESGFECEYSKGYEDF